MESLLQLFSKQNLKTKIGCLLVASYISVGLHAQNGKYKLLVTPIGHKSATKDIYITSPETTDAGNIFLLDSTLIIAEAVVVSERNKGKAEGDKTIYYLNKKILEASGNAPDVLRHIPGIQVDLKQNISIEGSQNILLLVDGKERDKSYISQLNPSQINRVEILNTPPSNYDGNVTGVINIILKKERSMGISGYAFSEIPTSKSVVYSFPTYSLNYSFNKINLYTSYNGEINSENIDETTNRQIWGSAPAMDISSVQHVKQKNLSHKFHYGIDYYFTSGDELNFYGFYNPYSYEQDGNVVVQTLGSNSQIWNMQKEETDRNRNIFNSLYYKHQFNKPGRKISIDISNAYYRSSNSIVCQNDIESGSSSYTNTSNPRQTDASMKIDFTTPLSEKVQLSTGLKANFKTMHDETSNGFSYNEKVYALFGALNYKKPKFDFNMGIRAEDAETKIADGFNRSELSVLPYATFQYKLTTKQNLLFSYHRSVNRPSVYYLNPYMYVDDPYTVRKGNSMLLPEFTNLIFLEHSIQFRTNYISYRLFYEMKTNVINNLTLLNANSVFETQLQNLGTIHQYGMQFTGSLKFGSLTFSPSVRLYHQSTLGNSLSKQYGVKNRENLVFELGVSSVLSLKHDFAFSMTFQYSSAKNNIQDNAFCDALYFISLDKTIKKNLKVGMVSALSFTKSFVYQGSEIKAQNFYCRYTGNLKLPTTPLMFRVSYQFNIGNNRAMIKRDKEEVTTRPKSGF